MKQINIEGLFGVQIQNITSTKHGPSASAANFNTILRISSCAPNSDKKEGTIYIHSQKDIKVAAQ